MGCTSSAAKEEQKQEQDYDKAVLGLKVARDRLKKYQLRLEADAAKQLELARKLISEKKPDKAKIVIRAKKMRENLISQTDGTLQNIQTQLDNLEQAKLNKEMYENITKANDVLKMMNEQLTVEQVESLMDENAEQQEKINEITNLLSENMSPDEIEVADEEYEALFGENKDIEEPQQAEEDAPEEDLIEEPPKKVKVAALA